MFQGTQEPFLKKERFLAWIISGNLWSDLLELFQGTKDEFPISHSQSLEAYKNECFNLWLPACYEMILAVSINLFTDLIVLMNWT